jgi:ribosomal protein S18 acetylase RimI-like enzyme
MLSASSTGSGSSFTVRSARPADVDGIVEVHTASQEQAYAPLAETWPVADAGRRREQWLGWIQEAEAVDAQRRVLVAERNGGVIGFVSGGPARNVAHGAELEIYVIHVLPAQRGAGAGALLWQQGCLLLRGPALRSMFVSTLAELRCCSFYERHGGQVLLRRPISFHGAQRTELIYFWPAGLPSQPVATAPAPPGAASLRLAPAT